MADTDRVFVLYSGGIKKKQRKYLLISVDAV